MVYRCVVPNCFITVIDECSAAIYFNSHNNKNSHATDDFVELRLNITTILRQQSRNHSQDRRMSPQSYVIPVGICHCVRATDK
jgi:hypothetical protein